jgi:hypothetical protein
MNLNAKIKRSAKMVKKETKSKRLTFRMKPSILKLFKTVCNGRSMNEVLEELIIREDGRLNAKIKRSVVVSEIKFRIYKKEALPASFRLYVKMDVNGTTAGDSVLFVTEKLFNELTFKDEHNLYFENSKHENK